MPPYIEPTLLTQARQIARGRNQVVDTLHLWYVALLNPDMAGNAAGVIRGLNPSRRDRMLGALAYVVEFDTSQIPYLGVYQPYQQMGGMPPSNDTSPRFQQCEGSWRQAIYYYPHTGLTNALVLATTLREDGITERLVSHFQLDQPAGTIQAALEHAAQTRDTGSMSAVSPLLPTQPGDEQAQQLARLLVKPIPVTREFQTAHQVQADDLLDRLAGGTRTRDVALAVGPNGSAIEALPQVIADRLANEHFAGSRDPLNQFRSGGLHKFNVEELRNLSPVRGDPPAQLVLAQAIRQVAQERRGILVVDHLEAVRGLAELEAGVSSALIGRGEAVVFVQYYGAVGETDMYDAARRYVPNASMVAVGRYDEARTADFINTFWRRHWAHRGWVFDNNAFDLLLSLEPGIWIDLERKTLPYAVVDVVEAAFNTATGGDDFVRATARDALAELDGVVRQELNAAQIPANARPRWDQLLKECRGAIHQVYNNPAPQRRQHEGAQVRVLRSGHLLAQLFAPNKSRFHLPGFAPLGAKSRPGVPAGVPNAAGGAPHL